MKLPVKIHRPFGPYILETVMPDNMVDELNRKTEEVCSNTKEMEKYCSSKGNIPNLLLRDFEVVYFAEEYLKDIGFKSYIEKLGNYYLQKKEDNFAISNYVRLSTVDRGYDPSFSHPENICYADAWVNRYYAGDYTPLHEHGSDLSGVIILKIPEILKEEQQKDFESEGLSSNFFRNNGNLQFIHSSQHPLSAGEYTPEQKVGNVILFPSWLGHVMYPMRNNYERRSMSFNLVYDNMDFEMRNV